MLVDINKTKIGVVGAGSWGTALANQLAEKGFIIDLWVFESQVKQEILEHRENSIFLPGITLSKNILPSNDFHPVASDKDLLLVVVPSHLMRETMTRLKDLVSEKTILVSASKGIENKTHLTMSGVLKEVFSNRLKEKFAVLSGPSFAKEVARGVPTLVTVAAENQMVAEFVQHVFATPTFRVYTIDDMIGVELGGAVKNVIAIASGIVDGLGLGLNTRAALITRGLTEIRRLGLRLGAKPETFSGLAGVGDLMLTCTGDLSRNHTVGKQIGQGRKLQEILGEMRMVAEGVKTAKSVYNLSRKLDVEMPISHEVYRVLYEDRSPADAVYRLMTRSLKNEFDEV
ncbi:MAG: NAD(P)-dependent glycerol-3-phosphate dehydrogenase [Desulfobacteraceae bacterium]|nr:MAG: NAD(P)-dependent glycerol-3-phosphate dehydrogenase [Desulfobacteraceae bacterium]